MAVVKNITPDVLSLFRSDAPPIQPGDEVTVKDENFVGRAWPKATWKVIEPPKGFVDDDTPDAYVFVLPEREAVQGENLADLPPGAYAEDAEPIPPATSSRTRAKKES